jgi:hypothetical protein
MITINLKLFFIPILLVIIFAQPISPAVRTLRILDANYESNCFKLPQPGPISLHKGDILIFRVDLRFDQCPFYYYHIDTGKKGIIKKVNGGLHFYGPRDFERYQYALAIKSVKRGSDTMVLTFNEETFIYAITVW